MARLKSMLKRVEVEKAKARRTCARTGSAILKGSTCIRIWDAPRKVKGYSVAVALQMVEQARTELNNLETLLKNDHQPEEE